jgi:hypothetical protein
MKPTVVVVPGPVVPGGGDGFWKLPCFKQYAPGDESPEKAVRLILDMHSVERIDKSTTTFLSVLAGQQDKMGGEVVLAEVDNITDPSTLSDLRRTFICFNSTGEAIASFNRPVCPLIGPSSDDLL